MPYKDNDVRLANVRKNTNKRRDVLRDFINSLKDKPCTDCGERFPPVCMDFDHRPGEVKSWCIGKATWDNRPIVEIAEEIRKCDLVCSNCHRVRTQQRRTQNGRL